MTASGSPLDRISPTLDRVKSAARRVVRAVRPPASESAMVSGSRDYWESADRDDWKSNSHWRDGDTFTDNDLWSRIGERHLEMVEAGARALRFDRSWNRVVEWGCGGGANAIHFAPRAAEFVGVDVSGETIEECGRQVREVCDTPFTGVRIDVADPEAAIARIGEPCDLFVCFYVFELLPSRAYGARVLKIVRETLAPGGMALIQVKYHEGTRPPRRNHSYRSDLANTTTYSVTEFWELAQRCGLTPESVRLIPRDELDERYAYFLLTRP